MRAWPSRWAPTPFPVYPSPVWGRGMDSPERWAVRGGLGPAPPPPPDTPPSAPLSPRAPDSCLGEVAAPGAGYRQRCCRWT